MKSIQLSVRATRAQLSTKHKTRNIVGRVQVLSRAYIPYPRPHRGRETETKQSHDEHKPSHTTQNGCSNGYTPGARATRGAERRLHAPCMSMRVLLWWGVHVPIAPAKRGWADGRGEQEHGWGGMGRQRPPGAQDGHEVDIQEGAPGHPRARAAAPLCAVRRCTRALRLRRPGAEGHARTARGCSSWPGCRGRARLRCVLSVTEDQRTACGGDDGARTWACRCAFSCISTSCPSCKPCACASPSPSQPHRRGRAPLPPRAPTALA